jgi:hypothetical protein
MSVMGVDRVRTMINNYTEFPEDIFAAMNTYYLNSTLENAQSLRNLLDQWQPVPTLNNVIEAIDGAAANVLTDGDENYINVYLETDPET